MRPQLEDDSGIPYVISADFVGQQAEFHSDQARTRLVIAANRSGKSFCGIREGVFYSTGLHPWRQIVTPNEGWIVVLDYKLGIKNLFPLIEMFAPRGSIRKVYRTKDDPRVEWKNGSITRLMSCEMGFEKFQSASIRWIHYDEEPPEDIYDECQFRLLDQSGDEWMTHTPTHGATYIDDRFVEPWERGELKSGISLYNWTIFDNKYLPEQARDDLISKIPEHMRAARLYGRTVSPEDLIWPEFDEKIHLVKRVAVQRGWPQCLVMDPGHDHPFGALMAAIKPNGALYFWRAYKRGKLLIHDHARNLANFYRERFPYMVNERLYNDLFNERRIPVSVPDLLISPLNRCIMDSAAAVYRKELAWKGIRAGLAKKDVDEGLQLVGEWFKCGTPDGEPMIQIEAGTCVPLLSELRTYCWKDTVNTQGERGPQKPRKRKDDCVDPLRYLIMSMPKLHTRNKMEPPPGSFNAVMKENQEDRRQLGVGDISQFTPEEFAAILERGMRRTW